MTYWASVLPVFSLGGTMVFAEMDPDTLTLDPADLEHRITDRTRAIIPFTTAATPRTWILSWRSPRGVGSRSSRTCLTPRAVCTRSPAGDYRPRGRHVHHVGQVSGLRRGGFLITDDVEIYERAAAFGHYERTKDLQHPDLKPLAGMPLGGYKNRIHQLSSAVGRVQLKYYKDRIAVIQEAMHHFWNLLEGVPGIRAHRPADDSGSTMGGGTRPRACTRPTSWEVFQ